MTSSNGRVHGSILATKLPGRNPCCSPSTPTAGRVNTMRSQSPSLNAFTAAVTNSFVRVINVEKRNQNIRDDILEMNGMNPSYSRTGQGEHEAALKRYNEDTPSE